MARNLRRGKRPIPFVKNFQGLSSGATLREEILAETDTYVLKKIIISNGYYFALINLNNRKHLHWSNEASARLVFKNLLIDSKNEMSDIVRREVLYLKD